MRIRQHSIRVRCDANTFSALERTLRTDSPPASQGARPGPRSTPHRDSRIGSFFGDEPCEFAPGKQCRQARVEGEGLEILAQPILQFANPDGFHGKRVAPSSVVSRKFAHEFPALGAPLRRLAPGPTLSGGYPEPRGVAPGRPHQNSGLRTGAGRRVPIRRMGVARRLRDAPRALEYVSESLTQVTSYEVASEIASCLSFPTLLHQSEPLWSASSTPSCAVCRTGGSI
jgi:hypothetical protein